MNHKTSNVVLLFAVAILDPFGLVYGDNRMIFVLFQEAGESGLSLEPKSGVETLYGSDLICLLFVGCLKCCGSVKFRGDIEGC